MKKELIDIAKNICSVTYDKEDCRTVIRFLGVKLKIAGKELKDNKFQAFKDAGGNITEAPKADGVLRITQLANLQLLKEVNELCNQHGLKLWLTFGTLLGAVRHKGFIPWDDDIDVEMMREDYNKLMEIINSDTSLNFYCEMTHKANDSNIFLKIKHKTIPQIFVDIFPLDELKDKISDQERYILSAKLKTFRHSMNNQIKKYLKAGETSKLIDFIMQKREEFFHFSEKTDISDSDLVWGIDFEHKKHKVLIFNNSTYFPLKKIQFETEEFYCPNKTEKFLGEVFGDYMSWPPKLYTHHLRVTDKNELNEYFGEQTVKELEKFLSTSKELLEKI